MQAIATPVVSGMEKVQVIPPPKDVNPQILVWKGGAVLGKMESVSELWMTPADWVGLQLSCVGNANFVTEGNLGYAWSQRKVFLPIGVVDLEVSL